MIALKELVSILKTGEGSFISVEKTDTILSIKTDSKVSIKRKLLNFIQTSNLFLGPVILAEHCLNSNTFRIVKPKFIILSNEEEAEFVGNVKKRMKDSNFYGCRIYFRMKEAMEKILVKIGFVYIDTRKKVLDKKKSLRSIRSFKRRVRVNRESSKFNLRILNCSISPVVVGSDIAGTTIVGVFNAQFIVGMKEEAIILIDQHALHERIRLEKTGILNPPERAKMLACRGAIKSGEKISIIELRMLVKGLVECKFPLICAHGRPTAVIINLKKVNSGI